MNKYLLSIDFDGTLLRNDASISSFTLKTIAIFMKKYPSSIVLLNSGRPMNHMKRFKAFFLKEIEDKFHSNLYTSSDNGCWLINYIDKTIFRSVFEDNVIKKLWKKAINANLNPIAHIKNCTYIAIYTKQTRYLFIKHRIIMKMDQNIILTDSLDYLKKIDLTKFTLIEDREEYKEKASLFVRNEGNRLNKEYISSEEVFFMIMASNRTKATPIEFLMKKEAINKDNVYVFADSNNDIPSFTTTSNIIIPKSSSNTMKKYASTIVHSNNDDGIAKFIKNRFL